MNPRYLLAAGAFVVALFAGIFIADALRSEKVSPQLPELTGDSVVPVIPGTAMAADAVPEVIEEGGPYREVEVAAELHPIEGGGGSSPGSPGFGPSDDDPATPPEPGDPVEPGEELPPDPGFDFLIEPGLFLELMFDPPEDFPAYRFLDFCADPPDDAECPFGIGATVLVDYDGPGDPGIFDIAETLYDIEQGWWRCPDTGRLRLGEYRILIMANQPSRMNVSWHPADDPTDVSSVVVDTSAVTSPELGHWLEILATTGGPARNTDRVHHCVVIDGGRTQQRLVITASATSITDETATETFSFLTSETRRRPPITIAPLTDYSATVAMPVKGDGFHTTVLRVIEPEEELDCSEIERASLFDGTRPYVVAEAPLAPFRRYSGYSGSEEMGDIVLTEDWPYDPAYDTYNFWDLHLGEGRNYLVCMWWLRSPARSFDDSTVIDRESRWVTTPDRTVSRVTLESIVATSGGLNAEAIFVTAGCGGVNLPLEPVGGDEIYVVPRERAVLCDFNGYEQPDLTTITMRTLGGDEFAFAIPTPNTAAPGIAVLHGFAMDVERGSGLCGSSFGSCDPPTTVYPGPKLTFMVETYDGETGRGDWRVGTPLGFRAPPAVPRVLPELPRLDQFGSEVVANGRNSIRVTAGFDRPVRLVAYVGGADDDPCLLGERRSLEFTELRAVHTFTFDGLCPLREYVVDLVVTDEAGATVNYVSSAALEGFPWLGFTFTRGFPVTFFVQVRQPYVDPFYATSIQVRFEGSTTFGLDLAPENGCFTGTQSTEQEGEWRETVIVHIDIVVYDGVRGDGECRAARGGRSWRGSVVAEVTLEQLRAGRVVIDVPLVESDGSSPLRVQIVLIGTVRG